MRIALALTLILLTAGLVACEGSQRDPEDHVLKPQQEMLDRARGVEDQVLDAAERQRREIDEQNR